MNNMEFAADVKVMSKGQVTIPKKVRAALGIDIGDRVTFIVDGTNVKIVNSTVYTLMQFQKQMQDKAGKANLFTEEAVMNWISKSRNNKNESAD